MIEEMEVQDLEMVSGGFWDQVVTGAGVSFAATLAHHAANYAWNRWGPGSGIGGDIGNDFFS